LTKVCIAILLPLAAANGFIRSWSHLIQCHDSLGPHTLASSGISIGSPVFHSSPVCLTDRHTDRATSVAIGHTNVVHVMRLNSNNNNNNNNSKWSKRLHRRRGTSLCQTFPADRSSGSWDMTIFRFFEMAAFWHRVFVIRVFRSHTKSTWWSLSLCKIWLDSMQYSFDNMAILIFCVSL